MFWEVLIDLGNLIIIVQLVMWALVLHYGYNIFSYGVRCKMVRTSEHQSFGREQSQETIFVVCTRAYITKIVRECKLQWNTINLLHPILKSYNIYKSIRCKMWVWGRDFHPRNCISQWRLAHPRLPWRPAEGECNVPAGDQRVQLGWEVERHAGGYNEVCDIINCVHKHV